MGVDWYNCSFCHKIVCVIHECQCGELMCMCCAEELVSIYGFSKEDIPLRCHFCADRNPKAYLFFQQECSRIENKFKLYKEYLWKHCPTITIKDPQVKLTEEQRHKVQKILKK